MHLPTIQQAEIIACIQTRKRYIPIIEQGNTQMTNVSGTVHVATIFAYTIKADHGGGFRGVFYNRATKARVSSERMDTLAAAKRFAKTEAHNFAEKLNIGYSLAAVRKPAGEYYANVWVRADEWKGN